MNTNMKKLILTISIIFTMWVGASAQSDGFFCWGEGPVDRGTDNDALVMPTTPNGCTDNVKATPVGSGLLILTALGAAYGLRKRFL